MRSWRVVNTMLTLVIFGGFLGFLPFGEAQVATFDRVGIISPSGEEVIVLKIVRVGEDFLNSAVLMVNVLSC